jgi:hypothetical protein
MSDYDREQDGDLGGDDTPYMSDDDEFERDGTHETVIGEFNENVARRDELARQLEDLVASALEWSEISEDEDAQQIYEDLADLYERVNAPLEDTDDEVAE